MKKRSGTIIKHIGISGLLGGMNIPSEIALIWVVRYPVIVMDQLISIHVLTTVQETYSHYHTPTGYKTSNTFC